MYRGIRSFHFGPYYYCGRCGTRRHISEAEWQRGVLVCKSKDCQDTGVNPFVGDREAQIAASFEVPTRELYPDPKLTPNSPSDGGDDIIF